MPITRFLICAYILIIFFAAPGLAEIPAGGSAPTSAQCTSEAMVCPDGSAVGRTGPHCEFAPCPSAKEAGDGGSVGHVIGTIVLSPAMPSSTQGDPNERAMAGHVLATDKTGSEVAHVTSDDKGNFQVDLPAGEYTFVVESDFGPTGKVNPQTAVVKSGETAKLKMSVDTGIR